MPLQGGGVSSCCFPTTKDTVPEVKLNNAIFDPIILFYYRSSTNVWENYEKNHKLYFYRPSTETDKHDMPLVANGKPTSHPDGSPIPSCPACRLLRNGATYPRVTFRRVPPPMVLKPTLMSEPPATSPSPLAWRPRNTVLGGIDCSSNWKL